MNNGKTSLEKKFFFPKKFFRYYKPSFVFIYLLANNVYPSLDPVYFFEAYIGASCLFNRPPFHIYIYIYIHIYIYHIYIYIIYIYIYIYISPCFVLSLIS